MPILNDGDKVYVKYTIPKEIKPLITKEFLKEFENQLIKIFVYLDINTLVEETYIYSITSGWHVAFGKACILTKNNELYKYVKNLQWYDSDIFNDKLAEMIVAEKLIFKILSEKSGFYRCDECESMVTMQNIADNYYLECLKEVEEYNW